ncbi:MAG: hypothetical protein ACR5KW_03100 [Wolbachia sp.]
MHKQKAFVDIDSTVIDHTVVESETVVVTGSLFTHRQSDKKLRNIS